MAPKKKPADEIVELQQKLAAKEKENEALSKDMDTKQTALTAKQLELDDEKAARESIAQELAAKKEEAEAHQKAAEELQRTIHEHREQLQNLQKTNTENKDIERDKAALEQRIKELETEKDELQRKIPKEIGGEVADGATAIASGDVGVLDVSISDLEFARPFNYFLSVQVDGIGPKRRSDVSAVTDRPTFRQSSFLLPLHDATLTDIPSRSVDIAVYVLVGAPPAAASGSDVPAIRDGAARFLGEGSVSLRKLNIQQPAPITQAITFIRKSQQQAEGDQGKTITVGRGVVTVKLTSMRRDDACELELPSAADGEAGGPLPQLEHSLWIAHPFRCRLRAVVRSARLAPPVGAPSALSNVVMRLLRYDGSVLSESATSDVLVTTSEPHTLVSFNQEVVLPLPPDAQADDQRLQLSLHVQSGSASHSLLTTSLFLNALPPCHPLHLTCDPSPSMSMSLAPPPSLLLSLTMEPSHHQLPAKTPAHPPTHPVEFRLHGVPSHRPLPEPLTDVMAVLSFDGDSKDPSIPQLPVLTHYYDGRLDLTTTVRDYFASDRPARRFATHVVDNSRTPCFDGYVVRALVSPAELSRVTVLLYCRGPSTLGDAQLPDVLAGFATVDVSPLLPPSGSAPLQRSFLLDVRLLEHPTAAASFELEARVWPSINTIRRPSGVTVMAGEQQPHLPPPPPPRDIDMPSAREREPPAAAAAEGRQEPASSAPAAPPGASSLAAPLTVAAFEQKLGELRQDHQLTAHLMKEFNMRAAALKQAGNDIVELKKQISLLKSERDSLKEQLREEEEIWADTGSGRPPEGDPLQHIPLDHLTNAELAIKLKTTLYKYREEKGKVVEMRKRLEAAMKEVARGRGLQRQLEEIEKAHVEQAAVLQRLQSENAKVGLYRQTAKSQEKVIQKLEKVLESSLDEVQRSQQLQHNNEILKTENYRLQERVRGLLVQKGYNDGIDQDIAELQTQIKDRDEEIQRLEEMVETFGQEPPPGAARRKQPSARPQAPPGPDVSRLDEERQEWMMKCEQLEIRKAALENELREKAKHYGRELSSLKVELAKRDAQILHMQMQIRARGGEPDITEPNMTGVGLGQEGGI
ncbi:unnamed protein product [Vitrella brassicaformis CCMP3155]|uniref:C2 domain-containing protein n=1 Tax=Vitrella brassicaformis (strain CCMP3155) TaxID=1169540 RepID=A0A0G4F444_VITBC|nr:unnamed protein product [Vitrella brassicaformis CCMP3155]|eukprot:CEM06491.1 unnamed protein product [Vitrella brassicaformis CCMP3155]